MLALFPSIYLCRIPNAISNIAGYYMKHSVRYHGDPIKKTEPLPRTCNGEEIQNTEKLLVIDTNKATKRLQNAANPNLESPGASQVLLPGCTLSRGSP